MGGEGRRPAGVNPRDVAASPPLAKGDLGGFKKASNPSNPLFYAEGSFALTPTPLPEGEGLGRTFSVGWKLAD